MHANCTLCWLLKAFWAVITYMSKSQVRGNQAENSTLMLITLYALPACWPVCIGQSISLTGMTHRPVVLKGASAGLRRYCLALLFDSSSVVRILVLGCRGKFWAGIRAACEPLFHSDNLRAYAPLMHQAIDGLMDSMATGLASQEPVQVTHGRTHGWSPECSHMDPACLQRNVSKNKCRSSLDSETLAHAVLFSAEWPHRTKL